MKEKITLDTLTQDSVSVQIQTITTIDCKEYSIGDIWRKAYINSIRGRTEVQIEVADLYLSTRMAM